MRHILLASFLISGPATAAGKCEIPGDPVHWAYDACLFVHGTDDELHPSVVACADRAQKLIPQYGSCTAKRIFKDRLCAARQRFDASGQSRKECMLDPEVKGLAVRNGGL
jgi:hypothetical protein